jgi:ElaA protein
VRWIEKAFGELTIAELYAIVALRERVFVVEQACAYLDADGLDPQARHLWCDDLAAYARILPAGAKYASQSIGRVIVAPEARGRGLARDLMIRAIAACTGPIELGAQAHLEKFYASLGFQRTGDIYVEDGIPHVDMLRPA